MGEEIKDYDLFFSTKLLAEQVAKELGGNQHRTPKSITIKRFAPPIQIITSRTFSFASDLIASFDFTVCQAAIFWDGERFDSLVSNQFHDDCDVKLLRYTNPDGNDVVSSLARVVRFAGLGYSPTAATMGLLTKEAFYEAGRHLDRGDDREDEKLAELLSGSSNPADWDKPLASGAGQS